MTPLSFPIIINDRYNVWKLLMDNHVYCTVHWELPNEVDKNEFTESYNLSNQILSIPVESYS